jgi:hypothetical protein
MKTTKKIAIATILAVAAGWLSGCAVCYEEYGAYPCESRIIVAPPPVAVVEVVPVPPPPPPRRCPPPYWPRRRHPWH